MFPYIYRFTGLTLIVSSYRHFTKPEVTISFPRISKTYVFEKKKDIYMLLAMGVKRSKI